MKKTGEHILVNFGQTPFVYDIDGMMKQEQAKIKKAYSETSTEKLGSPSTSETELIQQLVSQLCVDHLVLNGSLIVLGR
jgi:Ran-binding protein 9/10